MIRARLGGIRMPSVPPAPRLPTSRMTIPATARPAADAWTRHTMSRTRSARVANAPKAATKGRGEVAARVPFDDGAGAVLSSSGSAKASYLQTRRATRIQFSPRMPRISASV